MRSLHVPSQHHASWGIRRPPHTAYPSTPKDPWRSVTILQATNKHRYRPFETHQSDEMQRAPLNPFTQHAQIWRLPLGTPTGAFYKLPSDVDGAKIAQLRRRTARNSELSGCASTPCGPRDSHTRLRPHSSMSVPKHVHLAAVVQSTPQRTMAAANRDPTPPRPPTTHDS